MIVSMYHSKHYPWLEPYWLQIQSLIKQSRLPHALLLSGIDGLAIDQLALTLGSALLCHNPTDNGYPCQNCVDCNLLAAMTHPDFHLISILDKKSAISIVQIRELVNVCRERPHQGGYRVVIIDPCDAMSIEASNALLKTLEEPGDDTLLILVSKATNSLPATVRSRCHLINFEPPTEKQGVEWLQEQGLGNERNTILALRLAHHAPVSAKQLLSSDAMQTRQAFLTGLTSATTARLDPVKFVANIDKTEMSKVTDWMYSLILDVQKLSYDVPDQQLTNIDQPDLLHTLASNNNKLIEKWITQLYEARRLLATSSNINPQLVLEDLIFRWIAIFK